jgi:hypothetical protein
VAGLAEEAMKTFSSFGEHVICHPLLDELERRGLSKQVAEFAEQASVRDMYGELPPAPHTYTNLSVPAFWMRELWLRPKTKGAPCLSASQVPEALRIILFHEPEHYRLGTVTAPERDYNLVFSN